MTRRSGQFSCGLAVVVVVVVAGWLALPRFDDLMRASPDAGAKSIARNAASQVAACLAEVRDARRCDERYLASQNTGLQFGSGPQQATVRVRTGTSYTVTGHSATGRDFTITRISAHHIERSCSSPGGACPVTGTW